jgi:hypothetical protein
LLPLSTRLVAVFIPERSALLLYWLNILATGEMLDWSWKYVTRARRLAQRRHPVRGERQHPQTRMVAQSLYAVGAAFCVINTLVRIAAIVLAALALGRGLGSKKAATCFKCACPYLCDRWDFRSGVAEVNQEWPLLQIRWHC